jgi:hypothetical protein
MSDSDEITDFRPRPRPSEDVTLSIPVDALASLRRVAETRDMPPEALMRFYIGDGLRQDLARFFSARILEVLARVLERHIPSEDQRAAILREIQSEGK